MGPASDNKLGCRSRRPKAAAALRVTRPVGRAPATAGTLCERSFRLGVSGMARAQVGGFSGRKEGMRGCIEVIARVFLPLKSELLPLFTPGNPSGNEITGASLS